MQQLSDITNDLLGSTEPSIEDLAYVIDILKPQLLAKLLLDYKNDMRISDPKFFNFSGLKYIKDFANQEKKLNFICLVLKIDEIKTYNYQNRDMVLRNLKIIDPKSNSIDLLLWDHLPREIDDLNIQLGDVLFVENANTRLDKTGKLVLNAGKYSNLQKITQFISIKRFQSKDIVLPSKEVLIGKITEDIKTATLTGQVINQYPIKNFQKGPRSFSMGKITIKDSTGTIDVVFWGNHCKLTNRFNLHETVKLTNLTIQMNDYTKRYQASYTSKSEIIKK
jgi:ssDNA-binding replication factor A large subunit